MFLRILSFVAVLALLQTPAQARRVALLIGQGVYFAGASDSGGLPALSNPARFFERDGRRGDLPEAGVGERIDAWRIEGGVRQQPETASSIRAVGPPISVSRREVMVAKQPLARCRARWVEERAPQHTRAQPNLGKAPFLPILAAAIEEVGPFLRMGSTAVKTAAATATIAVFMPHLDLMRPQVKWIAPAGKVR